jgi:hypothetical protein
MQTLQFPMTLTHRSNPHAQVVVANAEQLAQMPEEYLPEAIGSAPAVVTAAAAIPGVNLGADTGINVGATEETERRQSLDEAVDEFTAHVQAEETRLAAARAQIEQDRAALRDQHEALARERAEFEAQRVAAASTTAGTGDIGGDTGPASAAAEGAATGDAATPPAAPAKRTRGTKEGA